MSRSYTSPLTTLPDDILWLWWFDREGTIQSHGLNFITDFHVFVSLLAILQRFNLKHWGRDTLFGVNSGKYQDSESHEIYLRFPSGDKDGPRPGVEITVKLLSGATKVGPCSTDTKHYLEKGYMSFGYQARLVTTGIVHLLARWSLLQRLAGVYARDVMDGLGPVCGHTPSIMETQQHFSVDLVENVLGIQRTGSKKRYRMRRILVCYKLSPITDLKDLDLMTVWLDCFRCA